MPAFESRRVRIQPLTVTGTSFGAFPARISRTLSARLSIDRELPREGELSSDCSEWRCPQGGGGRNPASGSDSDKWFEIDSNKRSVAADVMRHRAVNGSHGSAFAKHSSKDRDSRGDGTTGVQPR